MNSFNKFENGKIYTIQCKNDDTLIYGGCTIVSLNTRFKNHKSDSKRMPSLFYKTVLQSIDMWDDWFIELVEEYLCDSSEELIEDEEHYIAKMGNLNSKSPRTRCRNVITKFCWFLTDKETIYNCPSGR